MDWWKVLIVVAITAIVASATGLLRTDPQDDKFIDFWAPELRLKKRLILAGIHAVVGGLGAVAAVGLEWIPTSDDPWWVANSLVYAGASVAIFRADVSGFKLGTATTGRSLLKMVEDRTRTGVDRRIVENLEKLMNSATDERLVVTAYFVLEKNYSNNGVGEVGYRELTVDISDAADVFDPAITVTPSPNPNAMRAWLREFTIGGIQSKQLVIGGHSVWTDASAEWADD